MTTSIGQHIWVANTAPIHSLVMPSLWSMLVNSFWVLDWEIIAVVVSATQTGSFVDGFAMVTFSKRLERGNLLHAYTCITSPLTSLQFSPSSAIFPQRGWLSRDLVCINQEVVTRFGYIMNTPFCSFIRFTSTHLKKCISSQPWHQTIMKSLPGPVHKKGTLEALHATAVWSTWAFLCA